MTTEYSQTRFKNRTYSRRESRITRAQLRALSEYSEQYMLTPTQSVLDLKQLFPGAERYAVEIGFGDGEVLVQMAMSNADTSYIGIEVYRPGVGKCLLGLKKMGLENVRLCSLDAREVFLNLLPPQGINEIFILFPDPWPKKRHHKRRLINPEMIELCASRLTEGGQLVFASDSQDYAEEVLQQLSASVDLENFEKTGKFYSGKPVRPQTRYERKALARGDPIYNLVFRRRNL